MTPAECSAFMAKWNADRPGGYLGFALPPWLINYTVDWTVQRILEVAPGAQGVAFRGISGALLGPIVAYKLGLNPIGIRKNEESHGGSPIHRTVLEKGIIERYVIVDDFIETGTTVRAIANNYFTRDLNLLGAFCYGWQFAKQISVAGLNGPLTMAYGVIPDEIHTEMCGY